MPRIIGRPSYRDTPSSDVDFRLPVPITARSRSSVVAPCRRRCDESKADRCGRARGGRRVSARQMGRSCSTGAAAEPAHAPALEAPADGQVDALLHRPRAGERHDAVVADGPSVVLHVADERLAVDRLLGVVGPERTSASQPSWWVGGLIAVKVIGDEIRCASGESGNDLGGFGISLSLEPAACGKGAVAGRQTPQ